MSLIHIYNGVGSGGINRTQRISEIKRIFDTLDHNVKSCAFCTFNKRNIELRIFSLRAERDNSAVGGSERQFIYLASRRSFNGKTVFFSFACKPSEFTPVFIRSFLGI